MRICAAMLIFATSSVLTGCTIQGDTATPKAEGSWNVVALRPGPTSGSTGDQAILVNSRTGETWQLQNGYWGALKRQ